MRLISCDNCAVILDEDKIAFPSNIWDDQCCIDLTKGDYNQATGNFAAYINCPVCESKIFKESK